MIVLNDLLDIVQQVDLDLLVNLLVIGLVKRAEHVLLIIGILAQVIIFIFAEGGIIQQWIILIWLLLIFLLLLIFTSSLLNSRIINDAILNLNLSQIRRVNFLIVKVQLSRVWLHQ